MDTYASMNSHNHITCALTLAHTAWISYTPEYAPALQCMDLSNTFDFPDVMTTASSEDIPSLEDVLKL